jgi:threonine/homoserine/homoserine lactone efflux protein
VESVILGAALGLFAGLIPGAFSAVVVTTALERGKAEATRVALLPLGTELPALLAAVFVLSRLPEAFLRWVGTAGGGLLLFIAWKVIRDAARGEDPPGVSGNGDGHFGRAALFGVLSPGPWAFWFLLGGPLLINRWHLGPVQALGFLAVFMTCFIGVMLGLAWAVASGRQYLSSDGHRRALKGAAVLLFLAGGVLIWQSWVGNFTEMVRAPERIQEEATPFPEG